MDPGEDQSASARRTLRIKTSAVTTAPNSAPPTPPTGSESPKSDQSEGGRGSRSSRLNNPEFAAKHKAFMAKVTAATKGSMDTYLTAEMISSLPTTGKRKLAAKAAEEQNAKRRRSTRTNSSGAEVQSDGYCWICHKEGQFICCETCPRVYHHKCLQLDSSPVEDWVCPECVLIMTAENMETRSRAMRLLTIDQLCTLLKHALTRMKSVTNVDPFLKPVDPLQFPAYKDYIACPMDIQSMERNIRRKQYGSTEAMLADCKWILHNCIIFNSTSSKLTAIAKSLIKVCKHEMQEVENCPDCYLNAHIKKEVWFTEACRLPHPLVWAKLKGFPYWPGKVMRVNSENNADIRFFGAHDRAWIPIKDVFLFSQKPPADIKKKRGNIDNCFPEVEKHIKKLRDKLGKFAYANHRTAYDHSREAEMLKILFPNYILPFDIGKVGRRDRSYSFTGSERSRDATPTPSESGSPEDEEDQEELSPEASVVLELANPEGTAAKGGASSEPRNKTKSIQSVKVPPAEKQSSVSKNKLESENSPEPEKARHVTAGTTKPDMDSSTQEPSKETEHQDQVNVAIHNASDQAIISAMTEISTESSVKPAVSSSPVPSETMPNSEVEEPEQTEQKVELDEQKDTEIVQKEPLCIFDETKSEINPVSALTVEEEEVQLEGQEELQSQVAGAEQERGQETQLSSEPAALTSLKDVVSEASRITTSPPCEVSSTTAISATNEDKESTENRRLVEAVIADSNGEKVLIDDDEIDDVEPNEPECTKTKPDAITQKQAEEKLDLADSHVREEADEIDDVEPSCGDLGEENQIDPANLLAGGVSLTLINKGEKSDNKKEDVTVISEDVSIILSKNDHKKTEMREVENVQEHSKPSRVDKKRPSTTLSSEEDAPPLSPALTISKVVKDTPRPRSQPCPPEERRSQASSPSFPGFKNLPHPFFAPRLPGHRGPHPLGPRGAMMPMVNPGMMMRGQFRGPGLQPRPPGPMSLPPSLPSTAGPVAEQLNRVAAKLADSLRQNLQETFADVESQSNPEGVIKRLQMECEKLQWRHQQELAEMKHNADLIIMEMRQSMEQEKQKALLDCRKQAELEKQKAILEMKKKQWCSHCGKEAIFYCCWNTSYCDYPCQQAHWPAHMSSCAQNTAQEEETAAALQQHQQHHIPPQHFMHHMPPGPSMRAQQHMAAMRFGLRPNMPGPFTRPYYM